MAFNNSIFSRFLDSGAEENKTKKDIETADTEKEDMEMEDNDEEEELIVPADLAPIPEQEPTYLKLEPNHPIRTLWHLRSETSGRLPAPALYLDVPPGQPELLNPDETRKELSRLLFTVTSTANKRLIRATSSKGKGGEPHVPNMDAEVVVFTTADDLAAWFLVYPPTGEGVEVDRGMLVNALRKSGIHFGVDEEIYDTLPINSNRYFHMHLVARGTAPTHGEDGRIEDLFSRRVKWTPQMSESGKIDYTELNLIQNVQKGDAICRMIPATPGVSGRSVKGKPIPCKPGKPAIMPTGRNTELSRDGRSLLASITGRVEFNGRGFQVNPVLEIKGNVDYSTGNINFLGDVTIAGDVCTGFNVKALGNITVSGVVEACKVEAGGDLTFQKGVKGDGQAVIQAHRNLYAKYLENCSVCVREDLQSDCIINCNIFSDGSVHVDSGRGVIIGGKIWAANSVYAKTVGTKAEGHTEIKLGGLPSAEFEYECLEEELRRLTSILELLEQQPDSPAKSKGLPTVRANITMTLNKIKQYKETLNELHIQEYVQKFAEQRLVCDMAYPGTELSIGPTKLSMKTETRYCKAALVDGEIKLI